MSHLSYNSIDETMNEGKVITVKDAATRLGVTERTIQRYCRKGILVSRKVGPFHNSAFVVLEQSVIEFEEKYRK